MFNRVMSKLLIDIIEDDEDTALSLQGIIKIGYPESETSIYADAEKYLTEIYSQRSPDLIIVDKSQPYGFGGVELIRRVRQERDAVPILGMSGCDTDKEMLAAGADLFLEKPVELSDIYDFISDYIGSQYRS